MINKKWLQKHKLCKTNNQSLLSFNYWALLAGQVKELEKIPPKPPEEKSPTFLKQFPKNESEKKVSFLLPTEHRDTNVGLRRAAKYVTINLRRQKTIKKYARN